MRRWRTCGTRHSPLESPFAITQTVGAQLISPWAGVCTRAVDTIIRKAIAKKPVDRYQSVDDLLDNLRRARVAQAGGQGAAAGDSRRGWSWSRLWVRRCGAFQIISGLVYWGHVTYAVLPD
jgi:hypothetical protein